MFAKSLQSCPALCDPTDCSLPGSSVHGLFWQEYRSQLPFPPPGNLPLPGIEPGSPTLQAGSLPSEPPGKPQQFVLVIFISSTVGDIRTCLINVFGLTRMTCTSWFFSKTVRGTL